MWVPLSHGLGKITCQQLTKSRPESSSDKICEREWWGHQSPLFVNPTETHIGEGILGEVVSNRGTAERTRETNKNTHSRRTAGQIPVPCPQITTKNETFIKIWWPAMQAHLPWQRSDWQDQTGNRGRGVSILIYPNPNPTLTKLIIICRNKRQIITIYKFNSININPPWIFGDWFKQQGRHRIHEKPPAQVTGTKNCTNVHPCQAIGAHKDCIALNNWGSIWMIMSASNSKSVKPYAFFMKKTEDPPYLQYRWKSQQLYSKKSSTT